MQNRVKHAKGRASQREPERLGDTTCVVTGASRGIGRAIAERLGRAGADVAVNYRSSATAANDVVETIEADGTTARALAVQADVADEQQVATMADRVHDAFGPVDVLVTNAGITADDTFERLTHDDWDRVIDVNLRGAFTCTKAFFEDIRTATHGRLVTISSVVGRQGNYGQANYAAAKSALFGFTRSLAQELASHGSTANCVAPGYTRTDMVAEVRDDIKESLREQIPLGRFAEAEEIAHLVRYLVSPESSYVTGEIITIDGGLHL